MFTRLPLEERRPIVDQNPCEPAPDPQNPSQPDPLNQKAYKGTPAEWLYSQRGTVDPDFDIEF